MDSNSFIKIQVGKNIANDGDAFFKLKGSVSALAATEQKTVLSNLCDKLESDKSIIIVLNSDSYDATELKTFVDENLKKKDGIFKELADLIEEEKISFKVESNNNKVFI